ncbi:hypothetical protein BGX29_003738 [Mortierella sp. GBA35]|nr:hypothetical protein BGX29_003738 [Mortierella sp. GBA35]
MTSVGSLPADLAPGNEAASKSAMDLPPSPTNSVPFIVATSADDDKIQKPMAGPINGGSPMRPLQAFSKLDMEPNPFEQSFAGGAKSEKSGSSGPNTETGVETPKPVLPSIASMSGRLAPSNEFGWDTQSLRMGPLSPSMLEGPQQPIDVDGKTTQNPLPIGSFPPAASSITTVFTSGPPMAENGLPFVGLPGPLPVPPPIAVQSTDAYPPAVYNQPHSVPQSHLPSHQQKSPHQHHPVGPQGGPGPRSQQHFTHPAPHQQPPHDRYMPPQAPQHNNMNNNSNNHMNQYGNLHLLSQQAQASHRGPWIKRESMDSSGGIPYNQPPHPPHAAYPHHSQNHPHPPQPHPNAHPGPPQNSGQGVPGMGSHHPRNSVDSGFNQGTRRSRVTSEDYSDADSEQSSKNSANGGDHSGNSKKKPKPADDKMDEEEKRKNFLERNRQAALKCRQRKKQWLTNLQAKVEYLTNDNEHLQAQTSALRDEIIHLKALLLAHKDCSVAQANGVYADTIGMASHAAMMNHGRPPHSMQQQQQQQPGPLRGPGPGPSSGQPRGSLPPPPPSHQQQPGLMQGGPRMMSQPIPGSVPQHAGSVGPMGNVVGGDGRPMSMMQNITPNASPSQGQANIHYSQ